MGESVSSFWDQIDAILVINLAHRTDRWDRIYTCLEKIGVADKVHRIDAVDGKNLKGYKKKPWFREKTPEHVSRMKAGSAGCCQSQKKVVAYAKEKNFQRILMLEDDAEFRDDLRGRKGDIIAALMQKNDSWDMIYLGYYQRLNKQFVAKREKIDGQTFELCRIRGPLLTHAIVMNRRMFDSWLMQLPDEGNIWPWMTYWGSIDSWIYNKFGRSSQIKIWGTTPRLVVQSANDHSDIVGRKLTVEESEGTHRTTTVIPLDAKAFERSLDLRMHEIVYQTLKRSSRVFRSFIFGYEKT